jgi:hypothetical protein
MADISITPANVVAGSGSSVDRTGTAGATITAGQIVAENSSNQLALADNNSATAALKLPDGFALNGASINQPLAIHKKGPLTVGGTLVAGVPYFLSDTPGGLCPIADLASGESVVQMGIAISTTELDVDIHITNVTN